MPFSERWFYGDALYIVDPWLYLALGLGVFLARRRRSQDPRTASRPARAGLLAAALYIAAMLVSNGWARASVSQGLARAGRAVDTRFMVTPVLANPLRRDVIVDTGERYEKGVVWFEPLPHFRPAGYGVDVNRSTPAAEAAMQSARVQAYLRWSRFPFFVIEPAPTGARVNVNDYRYSGPTGRDGWSAMSVDVRP
jgi:inner membrane protein